MDIIWYWAGFFVRETRSASNILDLMARTSRLLQAFESSILARRNVEIIQLVNQRNAFYSENFNSPASNEYATSRFATYEATGVPVPETGGKIRGSAAKQP